MKNETYYKRKLLAECSDEEVLDATKLIKKYIEDATDTLTKYKAMEDEINNELKKRSLETEKI